MYNTNIFLSSFIYYSPISNQTTIAWGISSWCISMCPCWDFFFTGFGGRQLLGAWFINMYFPVNSYILKIFFSSGRKFLHSYTATNRNPILHDWENLAALLLESVIFPCNIQLHYGNYLILRDPRISCLAIYFSLAYYGDQRHCLILIGECLNSIKLFQM